MSDAPMYGMLIRHEVADFDTWKRAFEAHENARRDGGIVMHNVHRNDENPNEVVVYLASPNLEGMQGFVDSDATKEAMASAGVTGPPEIVFVQSREMNISTDGSAKAGCIVEHPIANYDTWKRAFDEHEPVRKAAGVLGHSVNTVAGSDKEVVALAQSDSMDKLRALFGSPDLKEAMDGAGVTGPPRFTFVNHVEMKRY